jgi:transcriptional regulator with XRE-family HTH domain
MVSKKDSCWTEKWTARGRQLRKAGDREGLRRLRFGRYLCEMRGDKTQGETAARAKMERVEWNRIENGHVLPPPAKLPDIADALGIGNPAVLFKQAGYAVPKEFVTYDKENARRRFRKALKESVTLAQFLFDMYDVWQDFLLEMQYGETNGRQPRAARLGRGDIFLLAKRHLTTAQRLQLARELVKLASRSGAVAAGTNLQEFYNGIDDVLVKLRATSS